MWEKIQNFTEEKHEFVTGNRFQLSHQEHKTTISYIIKPYDIQEGNYVQKPSIRLSIDFRGHELRNKFLDELKTDIFSPHSAYLPKIWFASSESQLIAYFLTALLRVMPDLSKEIEEIALSLSLNQSCAYASLPEWLYVRGQYQQTYLYTPRTNRVIESVGLLRRNDINELAIKVKVSEEHFKNITIHMASKNDSNYEFSIVVKYITLHIKKTELQDFYDFLNDIKEATSALKSIEDALLLQARTYCEMNLSTPLLMAQVRSLADRLLKSMTKPEQLKSRLAELSDRLLNEQPSQIEENKKICEILFKKITSNDEALIENLKKIYSNNLPFMASHPEDFKYFLMRSRYYDIFINDQSDKYKDDHVAIIFEILPDALTSDLVYEEGGFRGGQETIDAFRRKLLEMMKENNTALFAHIALMILAKYWPINSEDPCTYEEIPAEKRLIVSTGHQFHIDNLMYYNDTRDVRDQIEHYQHKKLINPITNIPVFPQDDAHIRHRTGKNITLETLPDYVKDLYGFRHWKKYKEMSRLLHDTGHERVILESLSKIEREKNLRLFDNMTTDYFVKGLVTLINHDVSLERFMNFDSEKQILLGTKHWLLTIFISGIPPEKITALNVEKLITLDKWLYDRDFTQAPTIGEGWPNHQISNKKDLTLIMEKIEQLSIEATQVSNHVNSFSLKHLV